VIIMTEAKHILPLRRKREGRTNYKKRLALLKSGKPRLVIRRSNKHILLQLIAYVPDGDKVLLTISSKALLKQGWTHSTKSVPAAYFTGVLLGKAAKEKKVTDAIVDLGLQQHQAGNRICAAIKGAIDGGLKIPVSEEIFPSADRLNGMHLATAKADEVKAVAAKLGITLPVPGPKVPKADKKAEKKPDAKSDKKPVKAEKPKKAKEDDDQ